MSAHMKLISTCTGKYFYDVGKNQIVKVSEEEYKALMLYKNMEPVAFLERFGKEESFLRTVEKYKRKGFLSDKKPEKIIHPYTYIVEDVLSKQMHTAILQITQMCNLRCRYCPYSGNGYLDRKHINKSMSLETAKRAVDFVVDNGLYAERFDFSFYGGEPMIHYPLIREIVSYAKAKTKGKEVVFSMTTNGTFLTKETVRFLHENDFSVTVSLDGPSYVHDKNRRLVANGGGSFDMVYGALRYITEEVPDFVNKIGINAVWDMEESFQDIMEFFQQDPVMKQYNYAVAPVDNTIIDTSFTMASDNFYRQQFREMLSMMEEAGLLPEKGMLHEEGFLKPIKDLQKALLPRDEMMEECHFGGMCLAGQNRLFVDTDGNLFPCEKVSANSKEGKIGTVFSGFDYDQIRKIMNVGAITEEECKTCWCGQFCTCCFKFVDDLNEMSREKKFRECKHIREYVLKNMKDFIVLKETQRLLAQGEEGLSL